MAQFQKVAVLTGGGDCPGLNSALRTLVHTTGRAGIELVGVPDGFKGLIENKFVPLNGATTLGIFSQGGTILGSSNVDTPFRVPITQNGEKSFVDYSDHVLQYIKDASVEALLVIGGDGTQSIAHQFACKGLKIIGIPKTIDNDLQGTDLTIGFITAVHTAVEALDRLNTTAQSHHRIVVIEVMGRNAGWIALFAGLGGDADVILIPEIPFDLEKVSHFLSQPAQTAKRFSICLVAEGAKPQGGSVVIRKRVENSPDPIRLGGIGHWVADQIEQKTGRETRAIVLGHLLRGGSPVATDRVLATRLAVKATEALLSGQFDTMASYRGDQITLVPLEQGAGKNRFIDSESQFLVTAQQRGIYFGV